MPEVHYPHAAWNPGANAGYNAGRTPVDSVVCHYTVGRNSTGIGLQGYFHFLVSRDGHVQQFAEADAVCWHAGDPWNGRGPGIEVEYLPGADDDIFTPEADAATGLLVEWLHDEWGVPLDFYDGSRVAAFPGFITHRSLIQTGDPHSDYWPYLPRPAAPPTAPGKGGDMTVMWIEFNGVQAYIVQGGLIVHQFTGPPGPPEFGSIPKDATEFATATSCGLVKMSGAEWQALLKRSGVL